MNSSCINVYIFECFKLHAPFWLCNCSIVFVGLLNEHNQIVPFFFPRSHFRAWWHLVHMRALCGIRTWQHYWHAENGSHSVTSRRDHIFERGKKEMKRACREREAKDSRWYDGKWRRDRRRGTERGEMENKSERMRQTSEWVGGAADAASVRKVWLRAEKFLSW